jgi:molybdopterin synthase catalytic subunit
LGTVGLHSRGEITLEKIVNEIRNHPESGSAGALVTFMGIVRRKPVDGSGEEVLYLEYEAYREVAAKKLQELREDLLGRDGIVDISIHHVIDRVAVGEESLVVAVLGSHRKHAFPVLEEAVERIKKEIPIWKKEVTDRSSHWVGDNTADLVSSSQK